MGSGVRVEIEIRGPLFDGRTKGVVDRQIVLAENESGKILVEAIRTNLRRVLKNPTGFYSSRIAYTVMTNDAVRVHDSKVVYGPWLEGTSRRNQSTRFKGYATFRRTLQEKQREVDSRFERSADQIVKELS